MASATMRILLAQAAHLRRKVASLDIIEAFCNVHNPFKSYLELPPELHEILGRYVELLKCLYGTKQAAREFYEMLAAGLLKHGYIRCSVDAAAWEHNTTKKSSFQNPLKNQKNISEELS